MEASWKSETIEALKVLGGIANLNQILDVIIKRGKLDLSRSKQNSVKSFTRKLLANFLWKR